MSSISQIRSTFLDFFKRNGHTILPSSALVPRNDPTLLFTSAGMVQFKDLFTGLEKRAYTRAATSQKCLRGGGKHNDLENVGYTARHHTFFEMLGNFAFGDYFKEEAISFAWDLITKEYGLDKDRLLVTVYAQDEVAASLWQKIAGLPSAKIIPISTSDNFWSAGDTGPCGPCSEIFYDHGAHLAGGPPGSATQDGDRFVEIWNLVFMQYDQKAEGERSPLPRPSIDTGMGIERIAAVLQGVHDNYDTDLLMSLRRASADLSHTLVEGPHAVSHRVIADHLRASSFLIADGILPSNEGRGYVLRRIMRRGMRHVHLLGCKEPHLWRLVPFLVAEMGQAYPELIPAEPLIIETLRLEEERFKLTLERGIKLLNEACQALPAGAPLPGDLAFKLYDTYGFPLDLTQDMLKSEGRAVDTEGFKKSMEQQRAESRTSWAGSGEVKTEGFWLDMRDQHGPTEFLGYEVDWADGKILALVKDEKLVSIAAAGERVLIIINQTPFYGESGGQLGDAGVLTLGSESKIEVLDTFKKAGDLYIHDCRLLKGQVKVGDIVHMAIDTNRRNGLRAHHSATHLLHAALRHQFGSHVTQKGSLVAPDRLRFDFSHAKALTFDEIRSIEGLVNEEIRANEKVVTQLTTAEMAINAGAMALFGEKYTGEVRVVSMGRKGILAKELKENIQEVPPFSLELCGGTHVRQTGDVGLFKIISETGISSGVRRIEAVVGKAAEEVINEQEKILLEIAHILRTSPQDIEMKIKALVEEKKKLEREVSKLHQKALSASDREAGTLEETQGGVKIVYRRLQDVSMKNIRPLVDALKREITSGIVVVTSVTDNKVTLVVGVTDDLTHRFSAVDLVKVGAQALGGSGGGRADFAQAGGSQIDQIEGALKAIQHAANG